MSRTVTSLPIDRLWDDDGEIGASRKRWLSNSALREILRKTPVTFFVADVGHPLRRVDNPQCYDFWKSEVQAHVVDDSEAGFRLDDFPGSYAYIASKWSGESGTPIILLEKHH
jgi:hypothetical protein